jgi:hypothetical protein
MWSSLCCPITLARGYQNVYWGTNALAYLPVASMTKEKVLERLKQSFFKPTFVQKKMKKKSFHVYKDNVNFVRKKFPHF